MASESAVRQIRDRKGRFYKEKTKRSSTKALKDHQYGIKQSKDVTNESEGGMDSTECEFKGASTWREGRRVIELGHLLDQLRFCSFCRLGPVPLTVYSLVDELRKGLSGFFYVQCQNVDCGKINKVTYGKTHREKDLGMPCFVVNTKLGTAMVDSLGGPCRVNSVLATLDLPIINNRNLKKMEDRSGDHIAAYAKESTLLASKAAFKQEMADIAERETTEARETFECLVDDLGVGVQADSSPGLKKILSSLEPCGDEDEQSGDISDDHISPSRSKSSDLCTTKREAGRSRRTLLPTFPCVSRFGMSTAVDAGYQKRGFDSLTGHTMFMSKSQYGKKVVKTLVSHRTCGKCKWWARNRKGQPVPKHDCVKNHGGSARSIESSSGIKGVLELQQEGTPIEYLEGDGDNTLMAHLRDKEKIHLKKRFDKNHVVKNFGKHLYKLKNDKSVKISALVVEHLQKCLSYAFAKNVGNKDGLQENLKALIPHQFGDHSLCHPRFCGFLRKPFEHYVHRSLPYKSALKDKNLKPYLDVIMQPFISNAEQYIDMGSSQQCEHANRQVSLRAPKSFHYGNTKSLDYRVYATAAFINEGRHYITKVHSRANLSTGFFTEKYATKCQKHRKRIQERFALPATKRRRLVLKQERKVTQGAREALEGVTYQSGIGLEKEVDITQIPDPVPKGDFKPIQLNDQHSLISFDLETTDLIRGRSFPQITQIASIDIHTGRAFNQYVLPTVSITTSAEQVTGILVAGNTMTVKGVPVQAVPIKEALQSFCKWIDAGKKKSVLIAHNGRRFDFPILVHTYQKTGLLDQLLACAPIAVDSLAVMKQIHPKRSSYKQEDLVRDLLGERYCAHDAVEDVRMLGKLMSDVPVDNLARFTLTMKAVYQGQEFNKEKAKNLPSLSVLVANGICKNATAENIAGSGLCFDHLRVVCDRDGEDGLRSIFCVKNSEGQPRVTNTKRILDTVIPALVAFFSKKV